MNVAAVSRAPSVLRNAKDLPVVLAALVHAGATLALVLSRPKGVGAALAAAALGFGLAWSSNTIAHVHMHHPIFRSRGWSRAFSLLLTATLLVPQTAWAQRHFDHHAGRVPRVRWTHTLFTELALIATCLLVLARVAPETVLSVVAPGWLIGMALCRVQGDAEHSASIARTASIEEGISHYGRLYNLLWLNDGHHVEHHRFPSRHWSELPSLRCAGAATSTLPPILRPLGAAAIRGRILGALERLVVRPSALQRFVLDRHRGAFESVLTRLDVASIRRVAIVGGGIFPRTARLLSELLPDASLTIIDASEANLALARGALGDSRVEWRCARWRPSDERDFDLVVLPLAFVGDEPEARNAVHIVHAWMTDRRGVFGAVVSPLLFKRINVLLPRASR